MAFTLSKGAFVVTVYNFKRSNNPSQNEPLNPVSRDINTLAVTTLLLRMQLFSPEGWNFFEGIISLVTMND